ncbi:hypothetical protein CMO88_00705 [Candidatus Woesearchaeota archaeon]|nr:hypothetical protein [Candidatus Woesearchaeota archaeon]|tara:strand:+ start:1002 stop:1235 length:234 start_codon:yes stop_codon:yes gene_type:complete
MHEFSFFTTRNEEMVDLTKQVQKIVNIIKQSKLDVLTSLSNMVPKKVNYKHDAVDGNASAQIKLAILEPSETLTFKK